VGGLVAGWGVEEGEEWRVWGWGGGVGADDGEIQRDTAIGGGEGRIGTFKMDE